MTGGMTRAEGDFPFPSELGGPENRTLRKIRDFSNFLLVGGPLRTLRSLGGIVAGLISNVIAIIPVVFIIAALTIFANPTRDELRNAVPLLDLLGISNPEGSFAYTRTLLLFAVVAAAVLVILTAPFWALGWRVRERLRGVWIALLIIPLVALVLELQPYLIRQYWIYSQTIEVYGVREASCTNNLVGCLSKGIKDLLPTLTAISGVMAAFSALLGRLLRDGKGQSTWRSLIAAVRRYSIYLFAGLAVPCTIWIAYLLISRWGIAERVANGSVVCQLERDLAFGAPPWLDKHLCYAAEVLPLHYAPAGQLFLIGGLLGVLLWYLTPPNAYSLHGLYRDRISQAFLRYYKPRAPNRNEERPVDLSALKLSELDARSAPYHLLNAALNIHGSRKANERGRNADFFVFSKCFIGSRLTGWCPTKDVEAFAGPLDLGTAVTVSGAAVSANVGANVNRAIVFSLAMLNIRLGYWLVNPYRIKSGVESWLAKTWGPLWFLREAFGLLNERSQLVFLTDGGHIENLGLYELLRRRCRTIIVVDAEADPMMVLPSFAQVQRFARIDFGIRIDIDTSEISRGTLDYKPSQGQKGPHAAIGLIHYADDRDGAPAEKGLLIYIKASLSGDENDYIRDYRRRYPAFPQETTLDQFFSEEQFEAYRALGFHMAHNLFTGRDSFQGPTERLGDFAAFAKSVLWEDLACASPLLWSGRRPSEPTP